MGRVIALKYRMEGGGKATEQMHSTHGCSLWEKVWLQTWAPTTNRKIACIPSYVMNMTHLIGWVK